MYQHHHRLLGETATGSDGAFLEPWPNNFHFSDFPGDADTARVGTLQQVLK